MALSCGRHFVSTYGEGTEEEYKAVSYNGLVAPMIEAIKSLSLENEKLHNENMEMSLRLEKIEKLLNI